MMANHSLFGDLADLELSGGRLKTESAGSLASPGEDKGTDGSTPKNCSHREERQDKFSFGPQMTI
jgi:hypothetical protein